MPEASSIPILHFSIDPLGQPTVKANSVITIFTHVVHPSTFKVIQNKNNIQMKTEIVAGGIVGLAEGIIDDTCLLLFQFSTFLFFLYISR